MIRKETVMEALQKIYDAIWDMDIPSPTVPEYVEHHEEMQELMRLVKRQMRKMEEADGDTISRQDAIDFIDAGHLCDPNEPRWSDNEIVNFLKSRPSAQPEPPKTTGTDLSGYSDKLWKAAYERGKAKTREKIEGMIQERIDDIKDRMKGTPKTDVAYYAAFCETITLTELKVAVKMEARDETGTES